MIGVEWQGGGGHALMIGGCGNGRYYLHDPWGWFLRWRSGIVLTSQFVRSICTHSPL